VTEVVSFSSVDAMDAAFAGHPAELVDAFGTTSPLAVHRWSADADAVDQALFVRSCHGTTLDVGCGPGRLTAALAARAVHAMGIDISAEAVRQTRGRGAAAIRGDVFAHVPGAGTWDHAILADGNVGIGGDPARLLGRVSELIRPDGTILVELAGPGTGVVQQIVQVRVGERLSVPFAWAHLGVDAIADVAVAAGLRVRHITSLAGRYAASLSQGVGSRAH